MLKSIVNISLTIPFYIYSQSHWRTAISSENLWSYIVPDAETSLTWKNLNYSDISWPIGTGGFGYGDNDDGTELNNVSSVFIRKNFIIEDVSNHNEAILHADYDDGFIAYINGIEIARSQNFEGLGQYIGYDANPNEQHEAGLYQNINPESYTINNDYLQSVINEGNNVLAIQIHNINETSSDLSSNFFLSFKVPQELNIYENTPDWFPESNTEANITFRVNMANNEVSPEGVHMGGGTLGNQRVEMLDINNDQIYETSIQLQSGINFIYTFLNGLCSDYSCKEDLSQVEDFCGSAAYNDRQLIVPTIDFELDAFYFGECSSTLGGPFSSNLPIIIIETSDQEIVDNPRIVATMIIINNPNSLNTINDEFNEYDGNITIEIRGSSSQMFPKKQYALETIDLNGDNNNVSLLGMPSENDWILQAPFSDKSLMRNVIAYELFNEMGNYSSRTKFCELIINNDYKGLYVLMEKIKRDNNRVDISKLESDEILGDDLTGGYIIKIDKWTGNDNDGWYSSFDNISYQYHYPKPEDIANEQKQYIQNVIFNFESLMNSENFNNTNGYYSKINIDSFIDVCIISELSKNVDAYRLSSYLYKDKDSNSSLINIGPIWDYNLSFGNADYYDGWNHEGWNMEVNLGDDSFKRPFWWEKIWADNTFRNLFNERWSELSNSILSNDHIMNKIDSIALYIEDAQVRNFQRWPILNQYIWPNAYVGNSYNQELFYLKNFINQRLLWINNQTLKTNNSSDSIIPNYISKPYPNPFNSSISFNINLSYQSNIEINIYNLNGEIIDKTFVVNLPAGQNKYTWSLKNNTQVNISTGVYFIRFKIDGKLLDTKKILFLK